MLTFSDLLGRMPHSFSPFTQKSQTRCLQTICLRFVQEPLFSTKINPEHKLSIIAELVLTKKFFHKIVGTRKKCPFQLKSGQGILHNFCILEYWTGRPASFPQQIPQLENWRRCPTQLPQTGILDKMSWEFL